jgi:hypothetical protein
VINGRDVHDQESSGTIVAHEPPIDLNRVCNPAPDEAGESINVDGGFTRLSLKPKRDGT